MGVTSAPPVSTRVADSFVAVYYRVISALPDRLPELYGSNSELNHGSALIAQGPAAIGALAPDLPLAKAGSLASIASISVQNATAAGFVVAVIGTFRKKDNPAAVFAHTFVLEKQSHSHDDHFFCRNDIFVDLSSAPLPGGPPPPMPVSETTPGEPAKAPEQPQKDNAVASPNGPVQPPASAHQIQQKDLPGAETPVAIPPLPAIAQQPTASASESVAVSERELPDGEINGAADQIDRQLSKAQHAQPAQPAKQPPSQQDPAQSPPTQSESKPAADLASTSNDTPEPKPTEETEQTPEAATPAAPTPPAKKTWASIVSAKEEADAAAAAAKAKDETLESPAKSQTANVVSTDAPKQTVENASAQPPATESVEHVAPVASEETSSKSPPATTSATRAPASTPNGHRPGHVAGRGHPRTFGPTAVVQLAALNSSQLQDARALATTLREEFNMYGYKVRHVDVKAQKSIAFIEYETIEGVRAAVAAWANGARQEGPFAGIALNVSEKRPYNKWRPGSTRGGRGGARGGRRNRPASTPLS